MYLTSHKRLAILLHEGTQGGKGKTGLALLRYSPLPIVAVIDASCAGQNLSVLTGIDREVPIVESVAAALAYAPDVLVIGLAPSGGRLPAPWYAEVEAAMAAGLSLVNGLHTPLSQEPTLTALLGPDQWIWDVRQEPSGLTVGTGQARTLACRRVLAVGTDMAVGKMSTCLELDRASRRQGWRSKLIATGQTALMLGEAGVPLDAIRVDFASGAIEQQMMTYGPDHDVLYVEGQGSLFNPASTATLPLLRGSQPTQLVLAHKINLTHIQHFPDFAIPALPEVIRLYEMLASAAGTFAPAKVVGITLNTHGVDEADAIAAITQISQDTHLPCTDIVRFGADPILQAIFNSPAQ